MPTLTTTADNTPARDATVREVAERTLSHVERVAAEMDAQFAELHRHIARTDAAVRARATATQVWEGSNG